MANKKNLASILRNTNIWVFFLNFLTVRTEKPSNIKWNLLVNTVEICSYPLKKMDNQIFIPNRVTQRFLPVYLGGPSSSTLSSAYVWTYHNTCPRAPTAVATLWLPWGATRGWGGPKSNQPKGRSRGKNPGPWWLATCQRAIGSWSKRDRGSARLLITDERSRFGAKMVGFITLQRGSTCVLFNALGCWIINHLM